MIPIHNGKQSDEEMCACVFVSKNIHMRICTHVLKYVSMFFFVSLKKCSCNSEFKSLIHKGSFINDRGKICVCLCVKKHLFPMGSTYYWGQSSVVFTELE